MRTILNLPAVAIADRQFDVADVVLLGLADGSWSRLEDRLARGLALEATHPVDTPAVEDRVRAFRYTRRLIAAKELREWLAGRSLAYSDVARHCARELLVAEHGLDGDRDPAIDSALRAEAICSGELAHLSARLGDMAAMASTIAAVAAPPERVAALVAAALSAHASGVADVDPEARCARIAVLEATEAAATEAVATPPLVERCVTEHGLDWLRVRCVALGLPTEGAAREAVLCARVDRSDLEELGARLDRRPTAESHYLSDLSDDSRSQLVSAPIGEVVGPVKGSEGWRVMRVEERSTPTIDDPELVRRATAELVMSARARASAGEVRQLAVL